MRKICSKCREEKGAEEFYNDRNSPSGKSYYCKPCNNEVAKENRKPHPVFDLERNLNMIPVYKYDHHYRLLAMYLNVLEATQEESDITSTEIYRNCLGRTQKLQGARWSFEQRLPKYIRDAVEEWMEQENL